MKHLMAALLAFAAAPVMAQEPAEPEWSLDDLTWLEGCWEGTAFGGETKECWMTGPDGHMTGMFQLVSEGELNFTEIFHLRVYEDGPALRVKHFHPDITGWEEKDGFVSFELQSTEEGRAVFSGLTLELDEDGRQIASLRMKSKSGEVRTETLVYERVE